MRFSRLTADRSPILMEVNEAVDNSRVADVLDAEGGNVYIKSVHIESFGALSDVSYSFSEPITVIEGDNESGKSTLAAFIKFVLYGLSSKTVGGISEKSRWMSFKYGNAIGAMVIMCKGECYRIERSAFSGTKATKDSVQVINERTGNECFKGEVPGEALLGMSAEVFSQTAFVGQLLCHSIDGKTVRDAIENMLFSGSEALSIRGALSKIDDARVRLLHKNGKGGLIYELSLCEEELYSSLDRVREASRSTEEKRKEIERQKSVILENKKKTALLERYLSTVKARAVLDEFDEYDKALAEYTDKKEEKRNAAESAVVNGFSPDEDYITALKSEGATYTHYLRQSDSARSELGLYKERYTALKESAPEGIHDAIGGRERVISRVEAAVQRVRTARISCILSLVIFIVWAIASVATAGMGGILFFSSIAASVVFAISSAVLFTILGKMRSRLQALLARYGVGEVAELPKKLDLLEKQLSERGRLSERIGELSSEIDTLEQKMKRCEQSASDLLAKWGVTLTDFSDVEKTIARARAVVDRILTLEREETMLYSNLCRLKKTLGDKDKEKARAIVASRASLPMGGVDTDEAERMLADIAEENERLEEECKRLEIELASEGAGVEDPSDIILEIERVREKKERFTRIYKAYLLAYEALGSASEEVRAGIAPRLSLEAGEFVERVCKRDKTLTVGADLAISFREGDGDKTHKEAYLSGGTRDLAYIGLRISLAGILGDKTPAPMIFDESFSQIDEKRLTEIMRELKSLSEKGRQFIILTSNKRESEALRML